LSTDADGLVRATPAMRFDEHVVVDEPAAAELRRRLMVDG
jgi:hypothetical protein